MTLMSDYITANSGNASVMSTALKKTGPILHNGAVYAATNTGFTVDYRPTVEVLPNPLGANLTPIHHFGAWATDPVLGPQKLRMPHSTTINAPS